MSYCHWDNNKEHMDYHNNIWGVPLHDDCKHFEFIAFEVLQCGLSWWLVYGKRDILRQCFNYFDYRLVAEYSESDIERLMNTYGMIRSEKKIRAIISNAKAFSQIVDQFGSFDAYIWKFSDNKTIIYKGHNKGRIPASNGLSEKISKDLCNRGFKYMGPIVVYSHLQACGIINDHDEKCDCYKNIVDKYEILYKRPYKEKGIKLYS